jgi:hypothetical protein
MPEIVSCRDGSCKDRSRQGTTTEQYRPLPQVTVPQWRDQVVAKHSELATTAPPGLYADRSPTGTGKSHADILPRHESCSLMPL